MSWWEKKSRPSAVEPESASAPEIPPPPPKEETVMFEPTPKSVHTPAAPSSPRNALGRSVVAKGEIVSGEDLSIDGQFEGNIRVEGHCLTVGPEGQVKAEVRARQVIVQGVVTGNIVAREKAEIRRTGRVVGDIISATVAIEDGAYFKGSIDIARGETSSSSPDFAA